MNWPQNVDEPDFGVAVYWGVRIPLPAETDFSQLQDETDDRLVRATEHGLDFGWYRTPVDTKARDSFCLFIGRRLAYLGEHGEYEVSHAKADFLAMMDDVHQRLEQAGFATDVALHMCCDPNI